MYCPFVCTVAGGISNTINYAFLTLFNTYLITDMPVPRKIQDTTKAAIKRYDDGYLTAQQLADCMSALYETFTDQHEASNEQAAWLSSMERKKDHWRQLGYLEYGHYLASIDPHGKARSMIKSHNETVRVTWDRGRAVDSTRRA